MTTPLQRQLRKARDEDLVYEREFDGLFIYVYTQRAVRERIWNKITRAARGLILDGDGNIVARPFDKFFNLFECHETEPKNLPKEPYCIWEKVDGSLGIIFWNPIRECWDISTKGSLHSEQADFARETLLPRYADALNRSASKDCTILTEIIYPSNQIVVNYGDTCELRLLAMRHIHTGNYEHAKRVLGVIAKSFGMHPADGYGITLPTHHPEQFADLRMEKNMEGWVIQFDGGFRVKVKNPWYLAIHRALDSKSIKRIIELVEGGEWRAFWDVLPKELQKDFDDMYAEIRTAMWDVENRVQGSWSALSDANMVKVGRCGRHGRKDFAMWVTANIEEELRPIMYSILDGHDYRHHVFSIIKKKFK